MYKQQHYPVATMPTGGGVVTLEQLQQLQQQLAQLQQQIAQQQPVQQQPQVQQPPQVITSPYNLELKHGNFRVWTDNGVLSVGAYQNSFNPMEAQSVNVFENVNVLDVDRINAVFTRFQLPYIFQPFFKELQTFPLSQLYEKGARFTEAGVLSIQSRYGAFDIGSLHLNMIDIKARVVHENLDNYYLDFQIGNEQLVIPKKLDGILFRIL